MEAAISKWQKTGHFYFALTPLQSDRWAAAGVCAMCDSWN
jgi:hypothetical protein